MHFWLHFNTFYPGSQWIEVNLKGILKEWTAWKAAHHFSTPE